MYPEPKKQRSRLDLLVRWEIAVLDRFLHEAASFFGSRACEAGGAAAEWLTPEGELTEAQLLLRAQQLVLEATLHQLNNLVDSTLLALVWRTDPDPVEQAARQGMSRASLVKALETTYGVHVRFIPGWHIVERVRDDSNALKHRAGLTMILREDIDLNEIRAVRPNLPDLEELVRGVEEWLMSLIVKTEGGVAGVV